MRYSSVEDFYKDANIFITGATGFMGKILLHMLLDKIPNIGTVYILVRDRKGVSPQKRTEALFKNVIFEQMHKEMPSFKSKIRVVQGDITADKLGISAEDYEEVKNKVNIIFHCAATVRFDEELQKAIRTNVISTQRIVQLAKDCLNLKFLTYVSTAYSNSHLKVIEEKMYAPKTHYSELIRHCQQEEERLADLAREHTNIYRLTKAAAEQLVYEEAKGLPVSIFRPSIVISSWLEPLPGYIDNLYGPTVFMYGMIAGFIRLHLCDKDKRADLVPVDMVVNALICSAWYGANRYEVQHADIDIPIFNYTSSGDNPITWSQFFNGVIRTATKIPYSKTLWIYCCGIGDGGILYQIQNFFYHSIFGFIFDSFAVTTGIKLRLLPKYRRYDEINALLKPFAFNEWTWVNRNVKCIWNSLTPADQAKFPFNMKQVDWSAYLEKYTEGILVHCLEDKLDIETRKYALQRYKRIAVTHYMIKASLYLLLLFLLWKLFF